MRRRVALLLIALIGLATVARVQGDDKPAPPKGGATPEDALKQMKKAAAAGDLEGTFGVLNEVQGKPILAWFKAQDALAKAMNACADAADAAFGKEDKSPIRRVDFDVKKEVAGGFEEINLTGPPSINSDNRARMQVELVVKGPDGKPFTVREIVWASKEGGDWKLSFEQLTRADFTKGAEFMDGMRKSIERTTAGIKDKTVKTRADAVKALAKDQPKSIPGSLPLPKFLSRPR